MRRIVDLIPATGVAIILCVGFSAGYKIVTALDARSAKNLLDVLTAIGTCGAVVVALGIAVWQERSRRVERLVAARILCTYLVPRLATMLDSAEKVIVAIAADDVVNAVIFRAVQGVSHPLTWAPPPEQLAALAPLPRATGYRAVRALSIANGIAFDIANNARFFLPGDMADAHGTTLLQTWESQLRETVDLLKGIVGDMKELSVNVS